MATCIIFTTSPAWLGAVPSDVAHCADGRAHRDQPPMNLPYTLGACFESAACEDVIVELLTSRSARIETGFRVATAVAERGFVFAFI